MAIDNKPTDKPEWIPDNTTNITDPGAKATNGWGDSGVEAAPSEAFNWFWNRTSQWIDYLDSLNHFIADYTIDVAVGGIDAAIAEISTLPTNQNGYSLTVNFAPTPTTNHEPASTIVFDGFSNGTIYINGADGTNNTTIDTSVNGGTNRTLTLSNCTSDIIINGFSGSKEIILESATTDEVVKIENCKGHIQLKYMDLYANVAGGDSLYVEYSTDVECHTVDFTAGSSGSTVFAWGSRVTVDSNCSRSNGASLKADYGSILSYNVSEAVLPGYLTNLRGSQTNINTYYLLLSDIVTLNPAMVQYLEEGSTLIIYNAAFAVEQARIKILNIIGGRLYYEQVSGNVDWGYWLTMTDLTAAAGCNIVAAGDRDNTQVTISIN